MTDGVQEVPWFVAADQEMPGYSYASFQVASMQLLIEMMSYTIVVPLLQVHKVIMPMHIATEWVAMEFVCQNKILDMFWPSLSLDINLIRHL